jgi:hypothetical protein
VASAASADAAWLAIARAVVSTEIVDSAQRRKRKRDAAEIIARIIAKRLVEHAVRLGFVVKKKPPVAGSAPISR